MTAESNEPTSRRRPDLSNTTKLQRGLASWEQRLRVFGYLCEVAWMQRVMVLSAPQGLIIRVISLRSAEYRRDGYSSTEFLAYSDLDEKYYMESKEKGQDIKRMPPTSLFPTGYEDGMRTLGHYLDQQRFKDVVIYEVKNGLLVEGTRVEEVGQDYQPVTEYLHFTADKLAGLIQHSRERRNKKK